MNTAAPHQRLKIGEVAAITGLSVKTIRYYEEIGLLVPTVLRADSGYRLFDNAVLERLAFIKQVQSLGLSLTEVKDILQVHDQGILPCGEVKHHLQAKKQQIDAAIEALLQQRSQLEIILAAWNEHPISQKAATICPNLQESQPHGLG
ncbi:MAG: heavy metal-responsive transcriptional regulator [Leptolyngbyaceae cyanobacterium bins.349]|nr:heavy metal-responsive transcriptional regulator [Leptolyngbyaceae cyanobacterium bins.349]